MRGEILAEIPTIVETTMKKIISGLGLRNNTSPDDDTKSVRSLRAGVPGGNGGGMPPGMGGGGTLPPGMGR